MWQNVAHIPEEFQDWHKDKSLLNWKFFLHSVRELEFLDKQLYKNWSNKINTVFSKTFLKMNK